MRLAVLMFVVTGLAAVAVAFVGRSVWHSPAPLPPVTAVASGAQPPPTAPQDVPARADSCSADDLRLVKRDLENDVGGFYGRMVVTNAGRQTCTIQGYPVILEIQANRVVLRSQAVSASADGASPLVRLKPRRSASAAYSYTAADTPNCPPHERTQVLLPKTRTSLPLEVIASQARPGLRICQYRVQPFVEGVGATWQGAS